MDCAKLIGARVSNRERSALQMRGGFKIPKKLPALHAVPTTAGTGSECTLAAVVTDPENREKFSVASHHLVPLSATLDPELMISLPPHITAHTGMDALTHAVEAYIGKIGTSFTETLRLRRRSKLFLLILRQYLKMVTTLTFAPIWPWRLILPASFYPGTSGLRSRDCS